MRAINELSNFVTHVDFSLTSAFLRDMFGPSSRRANSTTVIQTKDIRKGRPTNPIEFYRITPQRQTATYLVMWRVATRSVDT